MLQGLHLFDVINKMAPLVPTKLTYLLVVVVVLGGEVCVGCVRARAIPQ